MESYDVWATDASSANPIPELLDTPISPSSAISDAQDQDCQDCGQTPAISYCEPCELSYCDICWEKQAPHKKRRKGHDRLQIDGSHAEDSLDKYQKLVQALNPKWTNEARKEQHERDRSTLWFAITPSDDNALSSEEYPRFGHLMGRHRRDFGRDSTYYPRMVSFVGGTGAGKSTLIRMLIEHVWDSSIDDAQRSHTSVPVVGDKSSIPTSSDVHLYSDPIGDRNIPETPLLYADCEGFESGNQASAAKIAQESNDRARENIPSEKTIQWDTKEVARWIKLATQATMRTVKRPLNWLQWVNSDRQDAIEQLFPRILYTFSDVVVYVTTETELKKIGKVLQQLVEWSQKSQTAAVNRTTLPSLIVVLNQSDPSGSDWDPEETTAQFLEENQGMMKHNKILSGRKAQLEGIGLKINNLKDILRCSYTSVTFIRIPRGEKPERMASQLEVLHALINNGATQAHEAKRAANMLLPSEHQDLFYQLAFEHFSKYKDQPFDFMESFFSLHPLPVDLENNFFNLFRATHKALIQGDRSSSHESLVASFIKAVAPGICSAIAIDVHRSEGRLPGSLSNLFRGDMSEPREIDMKVREYSYEKKIENAMQQFINKSFQCEFTDKETRRCFNSAIAHWDNRTHQDRFGDSIGGGPFENDFVDRLSCLWDAGLKAAVANIDGTSASGVLQEHSSSRLPELWRIRRESIREMYQVAPTLDSFSLSGCFWCLRHIPSERLPCGHWICEPCIVEVGELSDDDDRLYLVQQCDRHPEVKALNPPFEFLRLPPNIGRRLLSLDEGGVRGIVELEILAAMQEKLGLEIVLQDCFDLIGGAGVGGIIALGLALGRWGISEAIAKFKLLTPCAFKLRSNWSIWRSPLEGKYEYEDLQRSIHDAFGMDGEKSMMGTMSMHRGSGIGPSRVFVTASTKGSGLRVLTNYVRRQGVEQNQHGPTTYTYPCTVNIKDAAIATTAFPGFFPSFRRLNGPDYLGGAVHCSNPAQATLREAQRLWPYMLKQHPDILVSTGCGWSKDPSATSELPNQTNAWKSCMNTEATWNTTFGELSQQNPTRYIRLCPKFPKHLPAPDDVQQLRNEVLRHVTAKFLEDDRKRSEIQDNNSSKVDQTVRRLISTTFYFNQTSPPSHNNGESVISGHIRCRFKDTSDIIKAFGRKIDELKCPRFVLASSEEQLWSFDKESLANMKFPGNFCAPVTFSITISSNSIDIRFTADDFPAESISGCPLHIDSLFEET